MTPNAAPPMLHKMAMVTISISAEADRAITGGSPEPSLRDDSGGYRFIVDHKTLDRLARVGRAKATATSSSVWRRATAGRNDRCGQASGRSAADLADPATLYGRIARIA
jgi:hypothetical protein